MEYNIKRNTLKTIELLNKYFKKYKENIYVNFLNWKIYHKQFV